MTKDNFTLVIVFFPNCWNDSVPKVGIYLDGELLAVEHLYKNQDIIKFEYEIELDYGSHEISVKYENKNKEDVFWHEGKRLRENFIKIEKIYIDFVDLSNLVKKKHKPVMLLTQEEFVIKFQSPIYYWLLHEVDKF